MQIWETAVAHAASKYKLKSEKHAFYAQSGFSMSDVFVCLFIYINLSKIKARLKEHLNKKT